MPGVKQIVLRGRGRFAGDVDVLDALTVEQRLKILDRVFGVLSVLPIGLVVQKSQGYEPQLQLNHRVALVALLQGLAQRLDILGKQECAALLVKRTGRLQAVELLEQAHRLRSALAKNSIHAAGEVTQFIQAFLHRLHRLAARTRLQRLGAGTTCQQQRRQQT